MLQQETLIIDEQELIRTYSDTNKYIIQNETGIEYVDAIDIPNTYTYTETDKDIPKEEIEEGDDINGRCDN